MGGSGCGLLATQSRATGRHVPEVQGATGDVLGLENGTLGGGEPGHLHAGVSG